MNNGYQLGCVKAATRILGDKWTPVLLRSFFSAEHVRFCVLQDSTQGINPRTLSARLVMLEHNGIITKHGDSRRCEYTLTQKGRDLLPILQQMESWSKKHTAEHSANFQTSTLYS